MNPGGPGGSASTTPPPGHCAFGDAARPATSTSSAFDPRGVGKSTPLECADTEQTDEFLAADPDPDNPAEVAAARPAHPRSSARGASTESGDLTRHISTVEAAKDMDILRAALGERQLDYLGASYGTFLGATYADLFPTHVRRMVLDGAIDPSLSNEELDARPGRGFETALRRLPRGLRRARATASSATPSTQGAGGSASCSTTSTPSRCRPPSDRRAHRGPGDVRHHLPALRQGLLAAADRGAASRPSSGGAATGCSMLADQYASRGPDGYTDNSTEALYAVNCLDHNDYIPSSEVPSHFAEFDEGLADLRPQSSPTACRPARPGR